MKIRNVFQFFILSALIALSCAKASPVRLKAPVLPPISFHPIGKDILDMNFPMEEAIFESNILDRPMQLDISVLGPVDWSKKYPVIYLTDGYWRRSDHKYIHYLTRKNLIPAVIVVGIGYTRNNAYGEIRGNDLHDNPQAFMQAIQSEIMPYMENHFPVDTGKQILFGASYGGNFALYNAIEGALNRRQPFYAYIAACSAFYNGMMLTELRKLLDEKKDFSMRLFTSYGALEDKKDIVDPNRALADVLCTVKQPSFEFYHYEYPGLDHHTVTRPTLIDGLLLFLGEGKNRSLGFSDIKLDSMDFDFSTEAQMYDWEYSGCLSRDDNNNADPESVIKFNADFSLLHKGYVSYTFPGTEDLTDHVIKARIKLIGPRMPDSYFAFLVVHSTDLWIENRSVGIILTPGVWQELEWKITKEDLLGKPDQINDVEVLIEKAGMEKYLWKGQFIIDEISW